MGHSHPGVINAQVEGSIQNTVMNGHLQQNTDTSKLLELLSTQACKNGAKVKNVFLTTAGAMAMKMGSNLFSKSAILQLVCSHLKNVFLDAHLAWRG